MQKTILIADDEPQIVELLSMRLENYGYKVLGAYDALGAIQLSQKEKPDLIILDMKMPAGGGITVFENLKNSINTRNIPVIFITAYANEDIKQKTLEMGAKDFVAKPFDGEELLEKIKNILEV